VSGFHTGLGGLLLAGILIQGICGCATWVLQVSSKVRPDIVYYINLAHHVFGYILMFFIGIVIIQVAFGLDRWIAIAAIIIDLIGIIGFLIFRLTRPIMQKYNALPTIPEKNLPEIKSSRNLAKFHGNYFIFADKVYNLDNVISNHPGGYEVINHIRGR
jgi:hypothetical protein